MSDQIEPVEAQIDLAPTSWPKVIGIISIAWASLGLSCLACGMTMQLAFGPSMLPPELRDNPPPSMKFGVMQVIQTVISLVLSGILLAAGIQTMRRSVAGRTLHLLWALLSMLGLVWGLYAAWRGQQEMMVWAKDNPSNPIAQQTLKGGPVGMVIAGVMITFFAIWPVFCLIWFGAIKRTKESFGAEAVKDYI